MKLLLLISFTLALVSATSDPRAHTPCFTKARGRLPPTQCVFPFVYKGDTYDSCTTVDTVNGEAWCATVDTVRFTRAGKVLKGDVGDCDFQRSLRCGAVGGSRKSCRTKSRGQCIFPFSYKGQLYDKCTFVDSKEPWCAVVPTVSVNSRGGITDATQVDDCFLAPGSECEVEQDNSCTFNSDCRAPGKLCGNLADASCICKKGECKISSGCGISGAFFFTSCSDCDTNLDGCEDNGVCRISGSRSGLKSCVSK